MGKVPGFGSALFLSHSDRLPAALIQASWVQELQADEVLYRRGEPVKQIYVVERGRLHLCSHDPAGRAVPLYTIRLGECVSEAAIFAAHYCGDVVSEVRSRVRGFPKAALQDALRRDPELAQQYMTQMGRRFNELRLRLELRSLRSARERILQYLAASAGPGVTSVLIDRPLKSIADDLGLTHESFYRTLSQLVNEGTVGRRQRLISF